MFKYLIILSSIVSFLTSYPIAGVVNSALTMIYNNQHNNNTAMRAIDITIDYYFYYNLLFYAPLSTVVLNY